MPLTREEKKLQAYRMAELRLKQRFEAIDYVEDVLKPELEEMRAKLKSTVHIEIPSSFGTDEDSA